MHSVNLHNTYPATMPIALPLPALLFFAAFVLQLSRSIYLDAYEILGTRTDLMGFVVMGIVMLPRLTSEDVLSRLKTGSVALMGLFLVYLLICVLSVGAEFLPVFLSRHGLIPWLLVGFMSAVATEDVCRYIGRSGTQQSLLLSVVIPPIVLLIPAYAIREASEGDVETMSYQQVAGSATILILSVVVILESAWRTAKQWHRNGLIVLSAAMYFAASLILAYLIAKLQSTSIVLVYLSVAAIVVLLLLRYLTIFTLILILLCVGIPGYLFLPEIVGDLHLSTRFSTVAEDNWMISSVQARLTILELFWDQWGSSPLFGDYSVENNIGGEGNYVHSLPLSLLTHTGAVGFFLFAIAVYLGSCNANRKFRPSLLVLVVLGISILSTFFTWIPVWFILGSVLLMPRHGISETGQKH